MMKEYKKEIGGLLTGKEFEESHYTNYWNCNSDKKVEGIETIQELFQRVKIFIDEIKEKYKDKNILLVTHGGVARAIYFYFNELPKDGLLQKFLPKNCEINEYEI